ncbi:MAG: amino acid permease [Planctomycetota bacterium]|nr:MAG: amino acid permease [Planctomycetota bacterium]
MALKGAFRTKKLDDILAAAEERGERVGLKRTLGPVNLTLLGIGAVIGAGIFATVGSAAAGDPETLRPGAGPSLMLSFVITAVVCGFTALCYAEFASMVPISGSAYTYSYATLGELVAWIIGWDLMIEYAIGNVAVAISWSNYFRSLLDSLGVHLPFWMCTDAQTAARMVAENPELAAQAPHLFGVPVYFNFLAFAIVMLITAVLVKGIRESAGFNAVMVIIKILILMFFVGVALWYFSPREMAANWTPFQPNGWKGTLTGAAVVFFSYIGFDAVSTVAEETRNPGRDLPVGIFASLGICTLIYMVVAAVFTGLVPYHDILTWTEAEKAEPLTKALGGIAPAWTSVIVGLGAVVATTAVLLVFQLGQPRIFYSMARDGLLPPVFARVHPRYRTPHITTILTGLVVGVLAGFTTIDEMVSLTNIGTLFAFVLVCIGIIVLRYKEPGRPRPFRVPLGPWFLPGLGVLSCVGLMIYLPPSSWWRFIGWLTLGLSVYWSYGHARSVLRRRPGVVPRTPGPLRLMGLGFLWMALALFIVPHDANPRELLAILGDAAALHHARTLIAALLFGAGLASVSLGLLTARRAPLQ